MGLPEDGDITTEDTKTDFSNARSKIAEFLVNTPRDKISEVAPFPLDQHRPHSLIAMLSDVLRNDLCPKTVERQKKLNAIWGKYHKDADKKPIIPVDLEKDVAWNLDELRDTNLENWSYYYKQLRRGFKNEGGMMLTTLAQAEMEAEEVMNRFVNSKG
jgi:hypothetical protein